MPDFYYQIKTKATEDDFSLSNWAFPPLFSDKISAPDKKSAKLLIEEEYGRKFPLRVLESNLANEHYLLKISEITADDEYTLNLFVVKDCKECGKKFRRIDLYNDHNEQYKGTEFCSYACRDKDYAANQVVLTDNRFGNELPVIYCVKNLKTEMSYVGKTTQVVTLRWYQHFFQSGSCKFHLAIKNSKIEDWCFRVVETVITPNGKNKDCFVAEREAFWIKELNTIDAGYNSVEPSISKAILSAVEAQLSGTTN